LKRTAPTDAVLLVLGFCAAQAGGCGVGAGHKPAVAEVVVVDVADTFTVTLVGVGFSGTVDRDWPCSASQALPGGRSDHRPGVCQR
jgi:hypothetical protein